MLSNDIFAINWSILNDGISHTKTNHCYTIVGLNTCHLTPRGLLLCSPKVMKYSHWAKQSPDQLVTLKTYQV